MLISQSKTLIHPGVQLPYASSWLIFINLLKWNRFKGCRRMKEFLNPCANQSYKRVFWESGDDVSIKELELAMSLASGSLKYSFVDGWFPSEYHSKYLTSWHRMRIRHCPECIGKGYHSVVFYFARITHCPWHGLALEFCDKCTRSLDIDFPVRQGIYKFANQCAHLSVLLDLVPSNPMTPNFLNEVEIWVARFIEWVQSSIGLLGQSAYEVIATTVNNDFMDVSIAIDYLVQRIGPPGFNHERRREATILLLPRSKKHLLSFDHSMQRSKPEKLQPEIGDSEMRGCLKSLRRYIYRRFVRLHIKCFKRMRKLSQPQWYRLNANTICPCIMSYLLVVSKYWHAAPFDFFHNNEHLDVGGFWKMKYEDRTRVRSEFQYEVICILSDFYRHWDSLRNYRVTDAHCMPCLDRFSGRVWVYNSGVYQTGSRMSTSEFWDSHLFMEDPSLLIHRSQSLCRQSLASSLTVNMNDTKAKSLVRVENVLCVLYNLDSKQIKTANIEI